MNGVATAACAALLATATSACALLGRGRASGDGGPADARVVLYRDRALVEAVYGEPGTAYDEAMFYSDKEALQRAIGRLCERIDPQRAYLTNKHGVGYSLSAAVA